MLSEFQKFRLRRSHLVVVRYCCGSPHESKGEIGTYFVRASALLRQMQHCLFISGARRHSTCTPIRSANLI